MLYNNINIFISKAIYLWYKTFCFTSKKFYNHVLMGERNWILESERRDYGQGEYYFKDSYLSADERFPDIARGEMAKKNFLEKSLDAQ